MSNLLKNQIFNTDSYKFSHFLQYPPKTQYVSSYIEMRSVSKKLNYPLPGKTVFFGLQAFIREYLSRRITMDDINIAEKLITAHGFQFNRAGWERIVNVHEGYFPIKIEALEEGSVVDVSTPLVQVVNTDPELPWVTSYLETALLRAVWYPTAVASISRYIKTVIYDYLRKTSDDPDGQISFKLHDFGGRGVEVCEAAGIGGASHLVNFLGTDTFSGIVAAMEYYDAKDMPGFSIPASEHSTITSWGRENELKAYENMVDQFAKPGAIFACVSDSYDIYNACEQLWGEALKQKIVDSGATLVIRPDSGDPLEVLPKVFAILGDKFGFTINSKGYKVLNTVRVIQGDGVTPKTIADILQVLTDLGWSADNIAFGMGGGLLQNVNRDTYNAAMKQNAISFDGETWMDVFKDPITDPGKTSKKGRQKVLDANGNNLLQVVYEHCAKISYKKEITFEEVRENAKL